MTRVTLENGMGQMALENDIEKMRENHKVLEVGNDGREYFIDGDAIDSDPFPISCVIKATSGAMCTVVLADGPFTGMAIDMPRALVKEQTTEKYDDISKSLFS